MKILVLIKPSRMPGSEHDWGIGSLDLYALSHGLELRDSVRGNVHAVVLGSAAASAVAQRALASGADEATHLVFEQPEQLDALALAKLLRSHISSIEFDLVLSGQTSDDLETGLVGPMLAELLGLAHVSTVTRIRNDDDHLVVDRDVIGGSHTLNVSFPALLVVLSGREIGLRYPTPRGMIAARKKPLHSIVIANVPETTGIRWSTPVRPERTGDGEVIRDVPASEAARRIANWLRERGLTG